MRTTRIYLLNSYQTAEPISVDPVHYHNKDWNGNRTEVSPEIDDRRSISLTSIMRQDGPLKDAKVAHAQSLDPNQLPTNALLYRRICSRLEDSSIAVLLGQSVLNSKTPLRTVAYLELRPDQYQFLE